jgi:hypothetical protein
VGGRASKHGVDDEERQALSADELDPDDPAVIAAIDLVRWELWLLSLVLELPHRGRPGEDTTVEM